MDRENNNNFNFWIQLLGSLILAFNNVRLDQEMRTTRSDINTDRRFAEAAANEQSLEIREARSNLRELRTNIQTTGRVSTTLSSGTMVLGGIGAVLLLLRGNSQKQQMEANQASQNDQIAQLKNELANAQNQISENKAEVANTQKQVAEHKTNVDAQLQNMNNEQTELKNKVEAQQAQEAEQTVESDQNASMSANPNIRVQVGSGAHVSAGTNTRADDLVREVRQEVREVRQELNHKIENLDNRVYSQLQDQDKRLRDQDKELRAVGKKMDRLAFKNLSFSPSTSGTTKTGSSNVSAVSGGAINKSISFKKTSGSPPETCNYNTLNNRRDPKDDDDNGGNIGESTANIAVNYAFINTITSPFNQIKYNLIKSNLLIINKEVNYIKNNSPIINKEMNYSKNNSPIIDKEVNYIKNKLNKNILFNQINDEGSGLIKSSYYYLDKKPSLNKDAALNTKIISDNDFGIKINNKNQNNFDYDYNNNLDYYYNNNLDYDYNNNLDYDYNNNLDYDYNIDLKPSHYLNNGDINWSAYFNHINKKTNLVYQKPLVAKVAKPLYTTKYQVIEKQILVVSNQQEILFYTLTPVIELIEFCVLNTNNPIFVGLFIPVMGSLYIFELAVLLIINFTTIYLLHKSLLILLNSASKLIFNKDILNDLNKTTNYFSNLIFLYLIFNSLYFFNFWLFFKISSLVFMKNLIKNKISITHCYTKYIDINREY